MGDRSDSEREVRQSRERLSSIAEELARRAQPGYLKDRARTAARQKVIHTKEAAVKRTMEMKDRAKVSPIVLGGLGAVAGALIGRALASRNARQAEWSGYEGADLDLGQIGGYSVDNAGTANFGTSDMSRPYIGGSYGSDGMDGSGLKQRAQEAASDLKSKVGDLKSSVGAKASDVSQNVREKVEDVRSSVSTKAGDIKGKAQEALSSARSRVGGLGANVREKLPSRYELQRKGSENPVIAGVGALLLGGLAAFLVPVSSRERRMIAPRKEEALSKVRAKVDEVKEDAQATVKGFKEGVGLGQSEQSQPSGGQGAGMAAGVAGGLGMAGVAAGWSASEESMEGSSTTGASYGSSSQGELSQSQQFGSPGEFSGGSVNPGQGYQAQNPAPSPEVERSAGDEDQSRRDVAGKPGGFEDDLHSIH